MQAGTSSHSAAAQIQDADSFGDHHKRCQRTLAVLRSGSDFKQATWDLYWFSLHAETDIDTLNIVVVCRFP